VVVVGGFVARNAPDCRQHPIRGIVADRQRTRRRSSEINLDRLSNHGGHRLPFAPGLELEFAKGFLGKS